MSRELHRKLPPRPLSSIEPKPTVVRALVSASERQLPGYAAAFVAIARSQAARVIMIIAPLGALAGTVSACGAAAPTQAVPYHEYDPTRSRPGAMPTAPTDPAGPGTIAPSSDPSVPQAAPPSAPTEPSATDPDDTDASGTTVTGTVTGSIPGVSATVSGTVTIPAPIAHPPATPQPKPPSKPAAPLPKGSVSM